MGKKSRRPTPQIDFNALLELPFLERIQIVAPHWVEFGFRSARRSRIHLLYATKLTVFICLGSTIVATTSGIGAPWTTAAWTEPIFYQKAVLWTVLWEILGLGASWGPLTWRFGPWMGGARYWLRRGTLRNPPWPGKVPLTSGSERTWWDVAIYIGILGNLVVAICSPGAHSQSLEMTLPGARGGLVDPALVGSLIALLLLMGLRDKVVFLASRAEQYVPAMVFFATLGFVNMIVSAKLLIVVVWIGAGVSKFGPHFSHVVPVMMSNAPFMTSRRIKRSLYRDFPVDLRPSRIGTLFAHVGGTFVEVITPLILISSTSPTVTLLAVATMVIFHVVITASLPMAVPLEWNLLFVYLTIFLFWHLPNQDGYGIADMSHIGITAIVICGLLFFPVLGNLRPDLVSFLPSLRQYAGNWASATWAFAPGAEAKLDQIVRSSGNTIDELTRAHGEVVAEALMQTGMAWRLMHTQGRALVSLLINHLEDFESYTLREGDNVGGRLVGWNFGDGHLFNEYLIAAVQERCHFEPGELVVAFAESQPIHRRTQAYKVIDAALGVIETGTYNVRHTVDEQPWLPNGPIPFEVQWKRTEPRNGESPTDESDQ